MKILVFGGNGYIGKHAIKYLVEDKNEVGVVDITFTDPFVMNNCKCHEGNILNKKFVDKIISNYDAVYNFAAMSNVEINEDEIETAIKINLIGLNNILEACVKYKIKRFIYASSVYALYERGGIYSITKRAAEDLIFHYKDSNELNFTILRYGTIYGPTPGQGNSLYRYLKNAVVNQHIDYVGDGNELREYIHIEDAAKLTSNIIDKKYNGEILLISGIHSYRVNDIFRLMREMTGGKLRINYKDTDYHFHYNITPFNYKERISKKVLLNEYTDIQQGLYNIMMNINNQESDQ